MLFSATIFFFQLIHFQWFLPWGNKNYMLTKYSLLVKHPESEIFNKKNYTYQQYDLRLSKVHKKKRALYNVKLVDYRENRLYLSDEAYLSEKDQEKNGFYLKLIHPMKIKYIYRGFKENEAPPKRLKNHFVFFKDYDVKKLIRKTPELSSLTQMIQKSKNGLLSNVFYFNLHSRLSYIFSTLIMSFLAYFIAMLFNYSRYSKGVYVIISVVSVICVTYFYSSLFLYIRKLWVNGIVSSITRAWLPAIVIAFITLITGGVSIIINRKRVKKLT